ncbi:hypothetical protein EJB05_01148, partial [Eragrostis curvula]
MAAEMVFSAVVEETLKLALSGLIGGSRGQEEDLVRDVERLEMARIRLEAALDASRRWRIRDAPLLRWRRKLERAAEECRRRAAAEEQEDDDTEAREQESFTRRLARAAAALLGGGRVRDDVARAAVRRLEWYADGAGEFLRFVEMGGGGSPRRCAPRVEPLIGHLLAGDELRYRRFVNRRGKNYLQFFVRPMIRLDDGRGVEAKLILVYEDDEAPEKNLCLGAILRLSESTDLVGTLVRCLELLVTPHFYR